MSLTSTRTIAATALGSVTRRLDRRIERAPLHRAAAAQVMRARGRGAVVSRKARHPIAADDVLRVFDAECINSLAKVRACLPLPISNASHRTSD